MECALRFESSTSYAFHPHGGIRLVHQFSISFDFNASCVRRCAYDIRAQIIIIHRSSTTSVASAYIIRCLCQQSVQNKHNLFFFWLEVQIHIVWLCTPMSLFQRLRWARRYVYYVLIFILFIRARRSSLEFFYVVAVPTVHIMKRKKKRIYELLKQFVDW